MATYTERFLSSLICLISIFLLPILTAVTVQVTSGLEFRLAPSQTGWMKGWFLDSVRVR